jgi:hypothetical protein
MSPRRPKFIGLRDHATKQGRLEGLGHGERMLVA